MTKEQAGRDFQKKKGESPQQFYVRAAVALKEHVAAMGVALSDPSPARKTGSVYLKGEEFNVAVSDHGPKPAKSHSPKAKPEYRLIITGSGVSAKAVNEFLARIKDEHGKAKHGQ